jgi:hypothetical protein
MAVYERGERPLHKSANQVNGRLHAHIQVRLAVGDLHHHLVKAEGAELKGVEVQVGVQLLAMTTTWAGAVASPGSFSK